MVDEREHGPDEAAEAPDVSSVTGGFFPSMLDIIIDPMKVFRRIDGGLSWWQPFIALAIIVIAISVINTPLQNRFMEMQYGNLDAEQLENIRANMDKLKYVGYVFVPILLMLVNLIVAGAAHLVNSIFSMRAKFKKTLSLAMYCTVIGTIFGVLPQIIGTVVIWSRGLESIESIEDMRVSFGLAAFMPDLEGFWFAFFESLSLFQIWYYILFVIGVATIFSIERRKAVVTGIVVWLLSILFHFLQNLGAGAMG